MFEQLREKREKLMIIISSISAESGENVSHTDSAYV